MATVGVFFPSESNSVAVEAMVSEPSWRGMPSDPINTPTLTQREVAVLQSHGFDLDRATIDAYVEYYSDYPTFVQVGS
jgi:hypothetical protein